jgi:hypothetical protein
VWQQFKAIAGLIYLMLSLSKQPIRADGLPRRDRDNIKQMSFLLSKITGEYNDSKK